MPVATLPEKYVIQQLGTDSYWGLFPGEATHMWGPRVNATVYYSLKAASLEASQIRGRPVPLYD